MIDVVAAMSSSSIGGGDAAATNVPKAMCRQLAAGFLRFAARPFFRASSSSVALHRQIKSVFIGVIWGPSD
jgi:hypothetical protein